MLARWSAGAVAVAVLAVVAMPATGQDPPPACPPGSQVPPDRFEFSAGDGAGDKIQSAAVTHPVQLFISVPNSGRQSVSDPAIHITGPPGLQMTTSSRGDPTLQYADFTPTAPGQLTFTATWTQLATNEGAPCTASASASLTATAPTPVKASRILGYAIRHRPGAAGSFNEFELMARVVSDARRGDRSPIRLAVRAVKSAKRPPASAPAATVTLDPNHIPSQGVRASTKLVRLRAGQYADSTSVYEFRVGVLARPPHNRGRARRGVTMTLTQGSRTLATFNYVTSCDSPFGGLECFPLPKRTPAP
jgi:hypothetical protein